MPKSTSWFDEFMVLIVRTIGYGFWALCLGSLFVLTGGTPRFFAVKVLATTFLAGMSLFLNIQNDDNDPFDTRNGSNRFFVRPINTGIIMVGPILYEGWFLPNWYLIAGGIAFIFVIGYFLGQDLPSPRWLRGTLALTGSIASAIAISFLPYIETQTAYCLVTAGVMGVTIAIWRWRKTVATANPLPS